MAAPLNPGFREAGWLGVRRQAPVPSRGTHAHWPNHLDELAQLPTLPPAPALNELVLRRALVAYDRESQPRTVSACARVPPAELLLYAAGFAAYLLQVARLAVHLVSR
ncbi:MAG TPA: hypothetical protein VIM73_01890 [Polyangiaceae bacterium]